MFRNKRSIFQTTIFDKQNAILRLTAWTVQPQPKIFMSPPSRLHILHTLLLPFDIAARSMVCRFLCWRSPLSVLLRRFLVKSSRMRKRHRLTRTMESNFWFLRTALRSLDLTNCAEFRQQKFLRYVSLHPCYRWREGFSLDGMVAGQTEFEESAELWFVEKLDFFAINYFSSEQKALQLVSCHDI